MKKTERLKYTKPEVKELRFGNEPIMFDANSANNPKYNDGGDPLESQS